jgi:hypothetical protein
MEDISTTHDEDILHNIKCWHITDKQHNFNNKLQAHPSIGM